MSVHVYQGLNPNALVSSGLARFLWHRRGEPCHVSNVVHTRAQ